MNSNAITLVPKSVSPDGAITYGVDSKDIQKQALEYAERMVAQAGPSIDRPTLKVALATIYILKQELRDLSRRLSFAESNSKKTLADAFEGAWRPDAVYARGALVQRDGSLWLALKRSTDAKPGGCDAWRLLVREGKDLR